MAALVQAYFVGKPAIQGFDLQDVKEELAEIQDIVADFFYFFRLLDDVVVVTDMVGAAAGRGYYMVKGME